MDLIQAFRKKKKLWLFKVVQDVQDEMRITLITKSFFLTQTQIILIEFSKQDDF